MTKKRKFLSKGHLMIMIVLRKESINKTKRKSARKKRAKKTGAPTRTN